MDRETRVDCQKRIDAVFDRHRTPAGLTRDAVAMDRAARARVDATLAASAALESFWSHRIGAGELQAEIDRMVSRSLDPRMLDELCEDHGMPKVEVWRTRVRTERHPQGPAFPARKTELAGELFKPRPIRSIANDEEFKAKRD